MDRGFAAGIRGLRGPAAPRRRVLRRAARRECGAGQRAGRSDPALDAEQLACAVLVFIMGLMHLETLAPRFVGDARWREFVRSRVAALVGAAVMDPGW